MKHPYRLPIAVAVLAMAATVVPPAMAKSEGHGQHRGGGRSSMHDNGGSRSGRQESADRGERRSHGGGERSAFRGSVSRDGGARGEFRGSSRGGERRWSAGGATRGDSRGAFSGRVRDGGGYSREGRVRDGGSGSRYGNRVREGVRAPERRVREGRVYARNEIRVRPGIRSTREGRSYGGYQRPNSYSSRIRYRQDGPVYKGYRSGYSNYGWRYTSYRPRTYYTSYFPRPCYTYRSGFSVGFVLGSSPLYGCGYFDPYCGIGFDDLAAYYDHCGAHRHTQLILVIDSGGGAPLASCVYRSGGWVVDDCYDRQYDSDGYDDDGGYDDGGYDDEGYDDGGYDDEGY